MKISFWIQINLNLWITHSEYDIYFTINNILFVVKFIIIFKNITDVSFNFWKFYLWSSGKSKAKQIIKFQHRSYKNIYVSIGKYSLKSHGWHNRYLQLHAQSRLNRGFVDFSLSLSFSLSFSLVCNLMIDILLITLEFLV